MSPHIAQEASTRMDRSLNTIGNIMPPRDPEEDDEDEEDEEDEEEYRDEPAVVREPDED